MKKKILLLMGVFSIGMAYAQVGVNTENPKTTFHVLPTKTDGSTAEGIIAPNLSRAQLISKEAKYTATEKGAIVYVTDLTGTLTTKTTKVTTVGYYYFDGSAWQPFSSGVAIPVTTANNGLTMSGTTTQLGGGLNKATVVTGSATNTLTLNAPTIIPSTGTFTLQGNSAAAGKYLMSDATGKGTWTALPAATVTTANNGLTMSGTTTQLGGTLTKETTITGTGANRLVLNAPVHIPGSGTFTLQGNGVAAGKYLMSDATGKGTWTVLPAAAVTTANNGLTMSGTTTQLGGGLNKATVVTGSATNTLTLNAPTIIPSTGTFTLGGNGAAAGRYLASDASGKGTWTALPAAAVTTANNGLTMSGTTTQLGGGLNKATVVTGSATNTLTLNAPTIIPSTGSFTLGGNGAANGFVLSSDASGKGTWKNQNMLSGSWFYLPSINLDMSTLTAKSVDLFSTGIRQLIATGGLAAIAVSPGAVKPTLPTTAAAYDYFVIGSSGHIKTVSITAAGVMTYTPTTINPPLDAYINIIVRVK